MLQRTAGSGFPVLLDSYFSFMSKFNVFVSMQRVVGPALLYTHNGRGKNEAISAEVENWVTRWKRGEEKRALVTDEYVSRGWEAPAEMVVGETGIENLSMRACGFCYLIKIE